MDINMEMTELERQHNCLGTIVNMLISRNWLSDNFENHFKKIISVVIFDLVFKKNYEFTTLLFLYFAI